MTNPLFVVLVSGDPAGHDDGFARSAWFRVSKLVSQLFRNRAKPGSPVQGDTVLRFIHFDCHTSTVGIYEHDFAKRKGIVDDPTAKHVGKNWKTLDANFQTQHGPTVQSQDPKTFVEWQQISDAKAAKSPRPISIVNVYHSVRKAPRGSVLELSIFSHAFVDGPVLFDGSMATPGSTRRSAGDSDGRAAIDFQPDMGEDGPANANACKEFRDAFSSTGSFRIWGCNIQDIVQTIPPTGGTQPERCLIMSTVRQVVEASYSRQLQLGGPARQLLLDNKQLPPGSTSFSLNMDAQIVYEVGLQQTPQGADYTAFSHDRLFEIRYCESFANHSYHAFFSGQRDSTGRCVFAKVINRSLSDIVKFVAAETVSSYFFVAAQALKTVTVMGGAPGTSADVDDSAMQHMSPARLDEATFFNRFMGVSIQDDDDLSTKGYAILDNGGKAVQNILDRAKNGLP